MIDEPNVIKFITFAYMSDKYNSLSAEERQKLGLRASLQNLQEKYGVKYLFSGMPMGFNEDIVFFGEGKNVRKWHDYMTESIGVWVTKKRTLYVNPNTHSANETPTNDPNKVKVMAFLNSEDYGARLNATEQAVVLKNFLSSAAEARKKLGVKEIFYGTPYGVPETYVYVCEVDNLDNYTKYWSESTWRHWSKERSSHLIL